MATERAASPGWIASAMGALLLVCAGFLLGLIVGVISEEPELVVGDLTGESEEVEWAAQAVAATSGAEVAPDVAAPPTAERIREAREEKVAAPPVSAAAQKVTPPVSAAPPSTGFAVQVGAFAESATAQKVAADLRRNGFETYVTPGAGARDGRWRVRVGPVSSREEAERVAARLKTQEKLPTWILSEGRN